MSFDEIFADYENMEYLNLLKTLACVTRLAEAKMKDKYKFIQATAIFWLQFLGIYEKLCITIIEVIYAAEHVER